ncbi:DASH complex subunit Duo1-domain-containing protein [Aspergillus falconensis]
MSPYSAVDEMDRLQLSDTDSDELWDSPSKRGKKKLNQVPIKQESSPPPADTDRDEQTLFDRQEAREAALNNELRIVRNVNQVIEGLLGSLDKAKGNMETVSRTVNSASTLLNTWTRILSQTEHNQRVILNPNWQGASQDVADLENEELLRQQAAERRERELQQQREAAARKAEEDERKRAQSTSTRGTRIHKRHKNYIYNVRNETNHGDYATTGQWDRAGTRNDAWPGKAMNEVGALSSSTAPIQIVRSEAK